MSLIKKGKAFISLEDTVKELINMGEETVSLPALKALFESANNDEYNRPYYGSEVAEELSEFINCMHLDQSKDFVETVLSDHRTLQSDTFNLFYRCFMGWAKAIENGNYDARNEGACKVSKMMIEAVE